MSEETQVDENLVDVIAEEAVAESAGKGTFSLFTKLLVFTLLGLGLTTAAVAYTAPELLAPIAENLPDVLFPESIEPAKAGGC